MAGNHQVKNEFDEIEFDTAENLLGGIAGLVPSSYDEIIITFTDVSKTLIDNIVYKLNGNTIRTVTASYPSATSERYVAS